MAEPIIPNILVNLCHNSISKDGQLPHQWKQDGVHVVVREVPCSGKIEGQYLFHSIESVSHGICVVACPRGQCKLVQGCCRAEVRMATLRKLLEEIGIEPQRAQLLRCSADDEPGHLKQLVQNAVHQLSVLGPSALHRHSTTENESSNKTTSLGTVAS